MSGIADGNDWKNSLGLIFTHLLLHLGASVVIECLDLNLLSICITWNLVTNKAITRIGLFINYVTQIVKFVNIMASGGLYSLIYITAQSP